MPQTPERRMYLAWKAAKARHDYRNGEHHTPLMKVARIFRVPIRTVRDAIAANRPAA
ncbi:hypothetical protein [Kitasatospora sp. NPDC005856]|uniref:hypothetical protein n=1 Tax=Kitasatospora sp. NPDC005856 TaxID=3154566 RepID=UPI0033F4A69F